MRVERREVTRLLSRTFIPTHPVRIGWDSHRTICQVRVYPFLEVSAGRRRQDIASFKFNVHRELQILQRQDEDLLTVTTNWHNSQHWVPVHEEGSFEHIP